MKLNKLVRTGLTKSQTFCKHVQTGFSHTVGAHHCHLQVKLVHVYIYVVNKLYNGHQWVTGNERKDDCHGLAGKMDLVFE